MADLDGCQTLLKWVCVPVRACNGGVCQLGHVMGGGGVPVRACMQNRRTTLHTGREHTLATTHLAG